jgi:hypothetical protein
MKAMHRKKYSQLNNGEIDLKIIQHVIYFMLLTDPENLLYFQKKCTLSFTLVKIFFFFCKNFKARLAFAQ